MKADDLYRDLKSFCERHADAAVVKKYSRFFKEGYDAHGVRDDLLHKKVDSILARDDIDLRLLYETARLLVKSGKYEETFLAVMLLRPHAKKFTQTLFTELTHWFESGIHNWAHTDVICRDLSSPLLTNKIIDLNRLSSWRQAANKYQRRAVPVSLLPLLTQVNDYKLLFDYIEPLMQDPERTVQQGLGWFLREAWKRKREVTEAFLLKWKETAPRVIYQYATEKMTAEEKQRFKREKSNKRQSINKRKLDEKQ
jgi:3-methyladenine DNA glycosylase AlkD